jgi:pyruvate kinase
VPGVTLRVPTITDKDKADLKFGVEQGVDNVALSFVRRPEDILHLKQLIREYAGETNEHDLPRVIAKIEKHEAINNFDAILEETDGVMVARGDLGVELPAEQIPVLQKMIIHKCNLVGKPVITATQMLESMIQNPRPTRAEATDVANAILDGTDATMLSGETASGLYPVEAVRVMGRIAETIEREILYHRPHLDLVLDTANSITDAISQATCGIARELGAVAIITPTTSGTTARMVARCRPKVPIFAITHEVCTYRKLALVWGVKGIYTDR